MEVVWCKVSSWMAAEVCTIDTQKNSVDGVIIKFVLFLLKWLLCYYWGCGNAVGIASSMVNRTDIGFSF